MTDRSDERTPDGSAEGPARKPQQNQAPPDLPSKPFAGARSLRPSAARCTPSFLSLHLTRSPELIRQRLRCPARWESTAPQEAPVPPLARQQVPLSAPGANQQLLAIDSLHVDA